MIAQRGAPYISTMAHCLRIVALAPSFISI
jgi:hypothetical protein